MRSRIERRYWSDSRERGITSSLRRTVSSVAPVRRVSARPGCPGHTVTDHVGNRSLSKDALIAPVPIIIVSALDTEADIVRGLELGAEDYIAKPYRLRELVARIRSVLRRVSPSEQPATIPSRTETTRTDVLTVGPFQVNFARRVVTANGEPIHLSRREFDLLVLLLSPPGQVRSREDLIDRLWSDRDLSNTRTLDTHIRRLRIKLEPDPGRPQYLVTVRGVGFRFES